MPNIANCILTVKHSDPAMITRMVNAYTESRLFGNYLPYPADLDTARPYRGGEEEDEENKLRRREMYEKYGFETGNDWRCHHWGTFWEMGISSGWSKLEILGENELKLDISTAWAAPTGVLSHWVELGYDIEGTIDEDTMNCIYYEYKNGVMNQVIYDREQYEAIVGQIVEEPEGSDCFSD